MHVRLRCTRESCLAARFSRLSGWAVCKSRLFWAFSPAAVPALKPDVRGSVCSFLTPLPSHCRELSSSWCSLVLTYLKITLWAPLLFLMALPQASGSPPASTACQCGLLLEIAPLGFSPGVCSVENPLRYFMPLLLLTDSQIHTLDLLETLYPSVTLPRKRDSLDSLLTSQV